MEFFDIDNLNKKVYTVGTLSQAVIDVLKLPLSETSILFSDDKIKYSAKHANEFSSYEEYKKCIEDTPNIILQPDYIALHPSGKSIEYIKRLDKMVLVAVRIKPHGFLWVKSFYPITEAKLEIYISGGTIKTLTNNVDI